MSHVDPDDPRCPQCGEPIGATATYCMHCSTDLTEEQARADRDEDGYWDESGTGTSGQAGARDVGSGEAIDEVATASTEVPTEAGDTGLLHPDGLVDDTLTGVVGVIGGFVVGLVGTLVLLALTGSAWAFLVGIVAWIAATVHLVRRRTVHDALSRSAYGVAIVLLLVPLVAFGPSSSETGLVERGVVFAFMLGGLLIPAAIAAGIGFAVARVAPETADSTESKGP